MTVTTVVSSACHGTEHVWSFLVHHCRCCRIGRDMCSSAIMRSSSLSNRYPMLTRALAGSGLLILFTFTLPLFAQAPAAYQERDFLTRIRRLTVDGRRAGEGYWSPDG